MNKVVLFSVLGWMLISLLLIPKNRRKCYAKLIWGAFTLILTLIGFFLAVGNEFFSQCNYDYKRIKKELFHPQDTITFSKIKTNSDKNPHYYFLLDVSGSMKNAPKVKLTDVVKKQIEEINNSGYCSHNGFDFDVNNGEDSIKYYRLMQVRLMHSIIRLSERHDTFKYSVITFAKSPCDKTESEKTIYEVFNDIYKEKYDGTKTDFVALLSLLDKKITNVSPANAFEYKECCLVFFSDYLHDVNQRDDKYEIEKKLRNFLWNMREKSVYIRLYSPKEINGNGVSVISLFDDIFPKSISEVLNEDDELICPIISKTPLTFYYNNSVFEESMATHLAFDSHVNRKTFSFGLVTYFLNDGMNLNDLKQEYYLFGEDSNLIHLSANLQPLTIGSNHSVELMIKGYIPAPYRSPDIVIQDKGEGIRYIIPVTFFKAFPPTGRYLLLFMLLVIVFTIVFLFISIMIAVFKWGKNKVRK